MSSCGYRKKFKEMNRIERYRYYEDRKAAWYKMKENMLRAVNKHIIDTEKVLENYDDWERWYLG